MHLVASCFIVGHDIIPSFLTFQMSRITTIEHPEPDVSKIHKNIVCKISNCIIHFYFLPKAERVNFETTVEFNWTIRDWVQLSTMEKVFDYVQEFHLVSSGGLITSKWLLGFEKRPSSVIGPYAKLLDATGCSVCEGSVEMFSLKKDEGVWRQSLVVSCYHLVIVRKLHSKVKF